MPEIDLSKYTKSTPKGKIDLSKYTKSKPVEEETNLRDYAAAAIRGASGFLPGGLIGAAGSGLAEGIAQTISTEEYNPYQIGAQAAIGAVPFRGIGRLIPAVTKGATLGATGTALTQQAEKGMHVPEPEELRSVALGGIIGGASGGISSKIANRLATKPGIGKAPEVTPVKKPRVKLIKGEYIDAETGEVVGRVKPTNVTEEVKVAPPVEKTIAPEIEPKIFLPKNLQGAKSGYRNWIPEFDNDVDKALMTIGQVTKNKNHNAYMDWLKKYTGMDEKALIAASKEMKGKLGIYLKGLPEGKVKVPQMHNIKLTRPESGIKVTLGSTPELAPSQIPPRQNIQPDAPNVPPNSGGNIPPNVPPSNAGAGGNVPPNNRPPNINPPDEPPPNIPPNIVNRVANLMPRTQDGRISFSDLWNLPKATAASSDLSAGFRQGLVLMSRKSWREAWAPSIRALKESNYAEEAVRIASNPRFDEAQEAGVRFTIPGSRDVGEEAFASRLAKQIPLIGPNIIAPSERAYTTFLNHLRMGVYDELASKAERLRLPDSVKTGIADYVNTASGRGNIAFTVGGRSEVGERAAGLLNNIFFSPRFIASRVQLLNPYSYVRMDPFTRKEALRDMGSLAVVASSVLGLAKLNGAEVTLDPTSTDFGKIKVGNTRIDTLGGFAQYIRLYSQITNGLATDEPGADISRFIESKLSPTSRMVKEIASGKDYFRRDISPGQSVVNAFAPMITNDVYQLWKEDPQLVPLAALPFFGIPTQSYGVPINRSGLPTVNLPKPPTVSMP
jgi:hypothetical protein